VTEYLLGRQKWRGRNQDKPDRLETPEEIELAGQRESLFDRRSRRKSREDDAELSLAERKVRLVVGVAGMVFAMFLAIHHPLTMAAVAGGIGVGGGARAVWKEHVSQRGSGSGMDKDC
jgi:Flp pilus assembly protein TadB